MKLLNTKRFLALLTTTVMFFAACGKKDEGGKHKDKSIKEYYFDVYEPAIAKWWGEVADKAPEKKQVKGEDSFPKHEAENYKKYYSYQAYEFKDSNGNVLNQSPARDKTQVQKNWDDNKWEEDWKNIYHIEIENSGKKIWVSKRIEEKKDKKTLNKKVDKIHKEFIRHVKLKTQSNS